MVFFFSIFRYLNIVRSPDLHWYSKQFTIKYLIELTIFLITLNSLKKVKIQVSTDEP